MRTKGGPKDMWQYLDEPGPGANRGASSKAMAYRLVTIPVASRTASAQGRVILGRTKSAAQVAGAELRNDRLGSCFCEVDVWRKRDKMGRGRIDKDG